MIKPIYSNSVRHMESHLNKISSSFQMIRFISHHLGNRSHNERQRFEDYIQSQPDNVNRPYQTIVGLTGKKIFKPKQNSAA